MMQDKLKLYLLCGILHPTCRPLLFLLLEDRMKHSSRLEKDRFLKVSGTGIESYLIINHNHDMTIMMRVFEGVEISFV